MRHAARWGAAAAISLAIGLSFAPAVRAQGIIPSVIGATVSNMAAREREQQCQSGLLHASPRAQAAGEAATSALMDRYLVSADGAHPKDLAALFRRGRDVYWRGPADAAGAAPMVTDVRTVTDPFFRAAPGQLTLDRLVIAGDGAGARGSWSLAAERGANGHGPVTYVADFSKGFGGWCIQRLALYAGQAAGPVLGDHCHGAQLAPL
jgi:hypothetical protein